MQMEGKRGKMDGKHRAERARLCRVPRSESREIDPSLSPLMTYSEIAKILKVTYKAVKNILALCPALPAREEERFFLDINRTTRSLASSPTLSSYGSLLFFPILGTCCIC